MRYHLFLCFCTQSLEILNLGIQKRPNQYNPHQVNYKWQTKEVEMKRRRNDPKVYLKTSNIRRDECKTCPHTFYGVFFADMSGY